MKPLDKRIWQRPLLACFLIASFLIFTRPAMAIRNAENQDVRALLSLASQQASALDYDADQMQSLLRNDVSWQTHGAMLASVKEHVNQLSRTMAKLQTERSEASTWQQRSIDRVMPLLRELSENTTAAIEHINANQNRPVSGYYSEYLDSNAENAHEMAQIISETIQYGHTRDKMEKLEDQLSSPRS
ncbi:MAG TPA: hypothetical protein VMB49_19280 [Acidobacteriaceae bacterium]|nr:hypothetical protein [Acidobacteriaceae bacterium]